MSTFLRPFRLEFEASTVRTLPWRGNVHPKNVARTKWAGNLALPTQLVNFVQLCASLPYLAASASRKKEQWSHMKPVKALLARESLTNRLDLYRETREPIDSIWKRSKRDEKRQLPSFALQAKVAAESFTSKNGIRVK